MSSRLNQVRRGSVSQDWRKPLGETKSHIYEDNVKALETVYTMFSVALDEAIGMRRVGRSEHAQQVLGIASALCSRLAWPLKCLLECMTQHARHFGITPNMAPLNPGHFQSARSQRLARFNELFSRVLLTKRSQFVSKISTLKDLMEVLGDNFVSVAENLCEDVSIQPDKDWDVLDAVHYDVNTCLRETVVLYKSFLHALPESHLKSFEEALRERAACAVDPIGERSRHLAHRRMAFLKGQ